MLSYFIHGDAKRAARETVISNRVWERKEWRAVLKTVCKQNVDEARVSGHGNCYPSYVVASSAGVGLRAS